MPRNILVFAGNFVYTMFGNYACLDYDKRGEDEDKLWGTGKEKSNNAISNKRLKMKTSSNTCELDDHCSHSYSADENINEFTKMFLNRFSPVFSERVKFFGNLKMRGKEKNMNYKEIIKQMIDKGNELWEKEQKNNDSCGEGKCQGSWRKNMKLFWFATLSVLEFINQVLNKYGNNLPDLYFTTMAWANYIPSIKEYEENIFPKSSDGKRPDEISILMDNLIEPENQQNTDYTFKSENNEMPPLVVIDCGSSGTRIEVNRLHEIFKENCGKSTALATQIKKLIKESKKIVALHQVPEKTEYENNKDHEVYKFIKTLKKIFELPTSSGYKKSYGVLLATAGLRNWYYNSEDKDKEPVKYKTQAENIKEFVDILKGEASIASCQMLDGVNEAALEHNAVKNILLESNLYCPKDNLIMFSMGGQSTQGSNGKLHFSNDKLGAIALTNDCLNLKETENVNVKSSITNKLESFGDLGYTPVNQSYVFDTSECDQKRKFYYNPNTYEYIGDENERFLEQYEPNSGLQIPEYFKRCDTDKDGLLTLKETSLDACRIKKNDSPVNKSNNEEEKFGFNNEEGEEEKFGFNNEEGEEGKFGFNNESVGGNRRGSKKIRKRKRKSVKRNKQYGGKTSNKKVKKLRKRRFLSKRR